MGSETKPGRDQKAFTGPKGIPAGAISETDCLDAGLHDAGTWAVVEDISVGDLMLLAGFHERKVPHRNLPKLNTPQGASIIKALEFHTGMNYYPTGQGGGYAAGGIHACCTCII